MPAPEFIIRDGEMLAPPPVQLEVRWLRMFVVAANPIRLQALCDAELNLSRTIRYQPIGPFVVFYVADMRNIVPSGVVDEIDVGVWIPVFGGHRSGPEFSPERILAYTPYVWVDSSPALLGGRMFFGFPKHIAHVQLPKGEGPASYRVDTWLVERQGGRAEIGPLLRIDEETSPVIVSPDAPTGWLDRVQVAFDRAAALLDVTERVVSFLGSVPDGGKRRIFRFLRDGHGLPGVFLKQVPGLDDRSSAVYQAIVEAPITVRNTLMTPRVVAPHAISLLHCFSHRIADRLGLVGGTYSAAPPYRYSVTSSLALETSFSADVLPGHVMWEATAATPRRT